jgi:3-dehydroquinate synthase
MKRIEVGLRRNIDDSYQVYIGEGILERVGMVLGADGSADRHVIITDSNVEELHKKRVQEAFEKTGLRTDCITIAPGENAKEISTVVDLAEKLLSLGADRKTMVIALGGGVVGDLTGFTASIYMRGIPFVIMPTTLLAAVDSSIGGKTGVDAASGKNMLGTFYQPKKVFIDLDFLETLPDAVFRSGLAEAIKYGAIESPEMLDRIKKAAEKGALRKIGFLKRLVAESCMIKKRIVELDEHDYGLRRILNFGHTTGHAIEAASGYLLSHGESIAIGMAIAARLSEKLHGLPATSRKMITETINAVGLSDVIPPTVGAEDIIARLSMDKKKEGGKTNFVMLRRLGEAFVNGGIQEEILRETLEESRT